MSRQRIANILRTKVRRQCDNNNYHNFHKHDHKCHSGVSRCSGGVIKTRLAPSVSDFGRESAPATERTPIMVGLVLRGVLRRGVPGGQGRRPRQAVDGGTWERGRPETHLQAVRDDQRNNVAAVERGVWAAAWLMPSEWRASACSRQAEGDLWAPGARRKAPTGTGFTHARRV